MYRFVVAIEVLCFVGIVAVGGWWYAVPKAEHIEVFAFLLACLFAGLEAARQVLRKPEEATLSRGRGGDGGAASVEGSGQAHGGAGGAAGLGGSGGAGGDAHVKGDGIALGGEGGSAGGDGGKSPFELMGRPNVQLPDGSWLWDKGKGGSADE